VLGLLRFDVAYNPAPLFITLNVVFLTFTSLLVAVVGARSFLSGQPSAVLLLGTGALALGLGAALAATHAGGSGVNPVPAVYNTAALLAGACHFWGAVVLAQGSAGRPRHRRGLLALAYLATVVLLVALLFLVRENVWPEYFVQGMGMTRFGFAVVWVAAALFAMAAVLMTVTFADRPSDFSRWYGVGLGLIAIGLAGVSVQLNLGGPINWAARAAQYLGGICILAAVLASVRGTGSWVMPMRRALLESEGRYRGLVELSPDAILVHRDGRYLFANEAAARLFGVEAPEEIVGRSVLEWVHPNDRAAVTRRIEQAFRGASAPAKELTIVRTDGVLVEVEVAGTQVTLGGKPAIQLVMRDVTERRRVEDELRTSKRRAELMARTARTLLTTADPQSLVEDVCREVMAELDCQIFLNFLAEEDGPRLHLNACGGLTDEQARSLEWLDDEATVCGYVAKTADHFVAEDIAVDGDPRLEVVKALGIQAYACHPLLYQGILLGTLSFGTRTRSRFSEEDLLIARSVTDQVAVALARMRTVRVMAETGRTLERAQTVAKTGSWWLDTRRDRLLWSQETYRMFGVPPGTALTYGSFLAKVHPADREKVERAWAAAIGGVPYDVEHRILAGDEVKWVHELAEVDFDAEGRPIGGFGVVHDITDQRAVEDALRASLERQALAQRATKTGFWDWDIPGGGLSWSPELFELFGLEPAVPATFERWLGVIHPDDRRHVRDALDRAAEFGESLENEYRIVLPDGRERWINTLGDTTYGSEGRPQRMCGICLDITDRKRAEAERERLRTQEQALAAGAYARSLIEAALDPLVTISPEGKITDVNAATIKITGRGRDELIGTDFSDYFTDPESARGGYLEVFDKGSVTDYPLTIRGRDGRLTDVLYNASVYTDEEGNVLGVFAAARDITALKELEEQRAIAAMLQETLLDTPRELRGLRYGHLYRSATHGARVGGDFYDVFEIKNERFVVLVGDVSGHGVEAARIATLVKDVVHAFSHQFQHPRIVLSKTNALLLEKEIPGFVTMFLGVVDPRTKTLTYCSAGHPNAMLRAATGSVTLLEAAAAPLGVFPGYSWKEGTAPLGEQGLLFLYTDGAMEARCGDEFFGQERLQEVLRRWPEPSPEKFPQAVLDEVLEFSGGHLADDVAVLALQLDGRSGRPGEVREGASG